MNQELPIPLQNSSPCTITTFVARGIDFFKANQFANKYMDNTSVSKQEKIIRIIDIAKKHKVSNYEIWQNTGISESGLGSIMSGTTRNPREVTVNAIYNYLISKYEGSVKANAKIIGELEHYDYLVDTKFVEISPGRYKMRVPLVPEYARAGYLSGFSDKEYMESLPIHEPIVDKYHRGRYMAFEVSGDSMDDDSKRSVPHGSIVTAREIKRELWRSKFHTHRYPYYVIIHKTDGILIKEMIKHDTENGVITLHSLNEDKEQYPDFDVHLDDVQQIFNVVKKEETY